MEIAEGQKVTKNGKNHGKYCVFQLFNIAMEPSEKWTRRDVQGYVTSIWPNDSQVLFVGAQPKKYFAEKSYDPFSESMSNL